MNCLLKVWEKCLSLNSGIMAFLSLPLAFSNDVLLSLKRGTSKERERETLRERERDDSSS